MSCFGKPKKKTPQASPLETARKAQLEQQQKKQQEEAAAERVRQEQADAEQRRQQHIAAERRLQAEDQANQLFRGSEYEKLCRQLNEAIDAIRSSGAQHTLDLPQVVVCGNQSAGKSSVLEALCDVKLPRSDGTCTRCPMEVRMASASSSHAGNVAPEPWSACVRVRRTHDRLGNMLMTLPEEFTVRDGISDKNEVEGVLRAAQDLVLDRNEPGACLFSRNTVVLEIRGAPVSLSLVDLPGIIHAMEAGSDQADYPALVKGMARDYISRPASIIVAVVTCKEDLDTQCVLSMAREVDPEGKRTIGVVTKPDCIEPGCHGAWVDVVTGRRWPLRLGYYVLKNPAQSQLGMDFATARAAEAHYFTSAHPWANLSTGYSSRFGAAALRSSLSKLMAHLISRSLPSLTASAQSQLSEVQAQLARLPPALLPPSARAPSSGGGRHMDGVRLMATLLDQISAQLMGQLSAVSGGTAMAYQFAGSTASAGGLTDDPSDPSLPPPPTHNLWIEMLQLFGSFKDRVYGTKPHFVVAGVQFTCITDEDPSTLSAGSAGGGLMGAVSAISLEELASTKEGAQSHPLAHSSSISVANTASLFGGGMHHPGRDKEQVRDQDTAREMPDNAMGGIQPPASLVLTFKDVKDLADSQKGLELPGFSPYSAVQTLISRSSRGWAGATSDLLHATTSCLSALTQRVMANVLSRFPAAHNVASTIAEALVLELNATTMTRLKELLVSETGCAFTMNRTEFEVLSSTILRQLREACAQSEAAALTGAGANAGHKGHQRGPSHSPFKSLLPGGNGNGGGANAGLADAQGQGMFTELGRDHVLTMIAVSLTYFKMSSRRFVDAVPMLIMHHLMGRFGPSLRERLMSRMLTGNSDADLHTLLAEDEATRSYREGLLAKNAMLETAVSELRKVGGQRV